MAKPQKGFQDDRSDGESGQPLQLDSEKKMNDNRQGGQNAEGEKQHRGGKDAQHQQGGPAAR